MEKKEDNDRKTNTHLYRVKGIVTYQKKHTGNKMKKKWKNWIEPPAANVIHSADECKSENACFMEQQRHTFHIFIHSFVSVFFFNRWFFIFILLFMMMHMYIQITSITPGKRKWQNCTQTKAKSHSAAHSVGVSLTILNWIRRLTHLLEIYRGNWVCTFCAVHTQRRQMMRKRLFYWLIFTMM